MFKKILLFFLLLSTVCFSDPVEIFKPGQSYYDLRYYPLSSNPLGYLTSAIISLNGLTGSIQTFAIGTTGTTPTWSSATTTHTLNLPYADGSDTGILKASDWTIFNNKYGSGDNPTFGTVNFGSSTGVSATATNGVLTLQGLKSAGNNENITIDFETTANRVSFNSTSGVTTYIFNQGFALADDKWFEFGNPTGTTDAAFQWETTGNDNFQLGLQCGSSTDAGYFSIMEKADLGNANRSPLATSTDPVLRVYSSDATQALDYGEFFHDQTDFNFRVSNGKFKLGGIGLTNNETLLFDFETTANTIGISSDSGATIINWGTLNHLTTGTLGAGAITSSTLTTGYLPVISTAGLLINSAGTGFVKVTVGEFSYDNSTYYKSGDSPSFADVTITSSLQIPNGASPTVDATGEMALDTTDNTLIIYNGTSAKVFGHSVYHAYFCFAYDGDWDSETIPISGLEKDMAITIVQVDSVVIGSSTPTLTFNIQERAWASYNSAGTNITSSTITADADGTTTTSFSNAGIAARAGLFLTTSTSAMGGLVDFVMGTIYYTKDVE